MKYVAGYSEINAGAYNIPVHTIYEYAEVVKERDAYNEANAALTIQLAALQAKLSAVQAGADRLADAAQAVMDNQSEYVRLNNLGDPFHNQDMQDLRCALLAYQAGTGAVDAKEEL